MIAFQMLHSLTFHSVGKRPKINLTDNLPACCDFVRVGVRPSLVWGEGQ